MTVTSFGRSRRARRTKPPAPRSAPPVRNTTALLYRHSPWIFLVFAAAVLVAFWPSYFSRLTEQGTFHAHTHGLAMTLWCALLIAQGWLMRRGNRALHRQLGALSYVLVPVVAVATLAFVHFRVQGRPRAEERFRRGLSEKGFQEHVQERFMTVVQTWRETCSTPAGCRTADGRANRTRARVPATRRTRH